MKTAPGKILRFENRKVTCEVAIEISKTVGARIFWRPGGVINWMLPELDVAEIVED